MKKPTVVIENSPASAVLQLWLADTFWTRLHGLMFKSQLGKNEGLWLRPCNSVHMCFMRFTLDIVYVDATGKIIKLVRHLRRWISSRCMHQSKCVDWCAICVVGGGCLSAGGHIALSSSLRVR